MFGIVYAIWRPDGQKVYVGKTVRTLVTRWDTHVRRALRNVNQCRALAAAILKYGAENMTVRQIDYATCEEELNRKERFWIRALNARGTGYNLTDGGEGTTGAIVSEEARAKMSAARKGKKVSPETRAKMSAASLGRQFTPETRARMSESRRRMGPVARAKLSAGQRRRYQSPEEREKTRLAQLGKRAAPEARAKMSAALLQRFSSPAEREKQSERMKRRWERTDREERLKLTSAMRAARWAREE